MPATSARLTPLAAVVSGLGLLLIVSLVPSSATRMQTWPFAAGAAAFWLLPVGVALARLAPNSANGNITSSYSLF